MASPPPPTAGFRLVGHRREPFRDGYHAFLSATWPQAIGAIVLTWLALNAIFATAYHFVGGVSTMRPDHWRDAFYFSVQTMGTIGYGVMAPESDAAHLLVVFQTLVGMLTTAVATGLVFAKFGRTTGRVHFARSAVIGRYDGAPTVTVRVGNERLNRIVDVRFKLTLLRTEHTQEGQTHYRMYDLELARGHTASLVSAFLLHHRIDERSALHGYDPARFEAEECELHVVVTGLDETTLQPVHAAHIYLADGLRWDHRYADMLRELPDGILEVDLGKFHETMPL